MMYIAIVWLGFVLSCGVIAYFGSRRQAVAFALIAGLMLPASMLALGRPAPWQPGTGSYTVLGARIDVDVAIYVLLDADPVPRFYRLPYSAGTANQLQSAIDNTEDGDGVVTMDVTGENALGFRDEQPPPEPEKQTPPPLAHIGG